MNNINTINTIIFIITMYSIFRVLFVIFVKRGYVMDGNVLLPMPVFVPYKMQIVLNVNVEHGITVVVYSCALIVQHIFVKMINLSIKLHVKFWIQKIINVMYLSKILSGSLWGRYTCMCSLCLTNAFVFFKILITCFKTKI